MKTPPKSDGERRKLEAHAMLEARRELYVNRGRRALLMAVLRGGTATADDVRAVVDLPPEINPKMFGAVPSALAKLGIIERAGFTPTTRAAGHARPVAIWALADRDAALDWLRAHPDTKDPAPNGTGSTLFGPPDSTARRASADWRSQS